MDHKDNTNFNPHSNIIDGDTKYRQWIKLQYINLNKVLQIAVAENRLAVVMWLINEGNVNPAFDDPYDVYNYNPLAMVWSSDEGDEAAKWIISKCSFNVFYFLDIMFTMFGDSRQFERLYSLLEVIVTRSPSFNINQKVTVSF